MHRKFLLAGVGVAPVVFALPLHAQSASAVFTGPQNMDAGLQCGLNNLTRYAGLQIEYSRLERTVERELIPLAQDQGTTVLAWSPLRWGF